MGRPTGTGLSPGGWGPLLCRLPAYLTSGLRKILRQEKALGETQKNLDMKTVWYRTEVMSRIPTLSATATTTHGLSVNLNIYLNGNIAIVSKSFTQVISF